MVGKTLKMDDVSKLAQQYDATASSTTSTTSSSTTATTTTVTTTASSSSTNSGISVAVKRIFTEFRKLKTEPVKGFDCYMSADNIKLWKIIFDGPESTVYHGGRWMLSLEFPDSYPFKAPELRFCTPIYHLNVNKDGKICMDILTHSFSPAITVGTIFLSLQSLIITPDPMLALDTVSANIYSDDKQIYFANARDHTVSNASSSLEEMKKKFQISDD